MRPAVWCAALLAASLSLLLGYDIGIMSGAKRLIRLEMNLNDDQVPSMLPLPLSIALLSNPALHFFHSPLPFSTAALQPQAQRTAAGFRCGYSAGAVVTCAQRTGQGGAIALLNAALLSTYFGLLSPIPWSQHRSTPHCQCDQRTGEGGALAGAGISRDPELSLSSGRTDRWASCRSIRAVADHQSCMPDLGSGRSWHGLLLVVWYVLPTSVSLCVTLCPSASLCLTVLHSASLGASLCLTLPRSMRNSLTRCFRFAHLLQDCYRHRGGICIPNLASVPCRNHAPNHPVTTQSICIHHTYHSQSVVNIHDSPHSVHLIVKCGEYTPEC